MKQKTKFGASFEADVIANAVAAPMKLKMRSIYRFECFDKNGRLKWVEEVPNIVVNVGLDDVLDKYFKGSAYTAAFYVGLKGTGSIVAGDTMSSHAGWSEIYTEYSEANRPALTLGSVSGQSVDNSASKASYSITASVTIYGAFMSTDNTKNGTSGILYGGADFGASRAVQNGDTLNVTVTLTSATA